MKTIKIIFGILLLIGAFGSLIMFFEQVSSYEAPETIGHLIAITLIGFIAYLLLKPASK